MPHKEVKTTLSYIGTSLKEKTEAVMKMPRLLKDSKDNWSYINLFPHSKTTVHRVSVGTHCVLDAIQIYYLLIDFQVLNDFNLCFAI